MKVMFRGQIGTGNQQFEMLWTSGTLAGLTDEELLNRFVRARDATGELAFRELVDRHGRMVLAICRQVLRHSHDVDDAFQATFLVLIRKARSIRAQESLGPWLSSVAYRTAQRARATASRYRPGSDDQLQGAAESHPQSGAFTVDLRPLLYEELERLPDRYRAPIVLCHLEGKTHEQAARLLRWPVGTLSGRLSRGRQLLRSRLKRRGVSAPAAIFAAPWLIASQCGVTSSLVDCTVQAATRFAAAQSIPASVLSLTKGVLKTMFLRKLGTISVVLVLGAVSGGAIALAHKMSPPGKPSTAARNPSLSSPNSDAPHPSSSPDSRSKSESQAGSQPLLADKSSSDCPADCSPDCPLAGTGDLPPYCPISMATNALTKVIGHFHDWASPSK
jgi:RNA polymerase sigma factor (sigma-70 family)